MNGVDANDHAWKLWHHLHVYDPEENELRDMAQAFRAYGDQKLEEAREALANLIREARLPMLHPYTDVIQAAILAIDDMKGAP